MRGYLLTVVASAALATTLSAPQLALADQEYKPKAEVEDLHQAALPEMGSAEIIVKRFTLPVGYEGEAHQHSGPVFVYVLDGELTVEMDEGNQTFGAGLLFPEPMGVTMRGRNTSTAGETKLLVFQLGASGKPMMMKAE